MSGLRSPARRQRRNQHKVQCRRQRRSPLIKVEVVVEPRMQADQLAAPLPTRGVRWRMRMQVIHYRALRVSLLCMRPPAEPLYPRKVLMHLLCVCAPQQRCKVLVNTGGTNGVHSVSLAAHIHSNHALQKSCTLACMHDGTGLRRATWHLLLT